jgi:16S rRNA G966 N2-methylase RsmD
VENLEFLVELLKEEIKKAEELIRKGYDYKKIKKRLKFKEIKINFLGNKFVIDKKEIIDLARGLIYAKKKKNFDFIFVKEKDAKYIFDKKIAKLRADHLKDFLKEKEFADLSCGYAVQSLEFLNYTKKAILIDKDPTVLFYAYLNAILFNKHNKVELINADSNNLPQEIKEKIKNLDFIYFEPFREKNLISPDFEVLINYNEKVIADLPKKFKDKINFLSTIEDEKGVSRITYFKNINVKPFYIVKIKNKVFLNDGEQKETKELNEKEFLEELQKRKIVYEYYESAYFLKLVSSVFKLKRAYLGFESEHYKNKFKLLTITENLNVLKNNKIVNEENENKQLKIVIRYSINPDQYYKEKKELEKTLDFEGEIHIFRINDYYLILEKCNETTNS